MKLIYTIALLNLLTFSVVKAQASISKNKLSNKTKHNIIPFQGQVKFCSNEGRQTYTVTITGNNVILSNSPTKIKGVFKNGLLFTNDPDEVTYRRYSKKHNCGKYYMIDKDYLNVLNGETGEYFFYERCDKK